jgi:excisionase family DNA binding protein
MRRSIRKNSADQSGFPGMDEESVGNNRSIMRWGSSESQPPQSLLLSVNETAALLGIHRATVYELLATGQLRSTTLGRRRVIPRVAVEAFVAQLDQRATQEAEQLRSAR